MIRSKLDPTTQINHVRPEELDETSDPKQLALSVDNLTDELNSLKAQFKQILGPSATHWYSKPENTLDIQTTQFNSQTADFVVPGNAVYMKQTGQIALADRNTNLIVSKVVGLVFIAASTGFGTTTITDGLFELNDWSAVFSSVLLTPGDIIFLGDSGKLTNIAPVSGFRTLIGKALSDKVLKLAIETPIAL